jgi:hypothetical protein
MSTRDGANTHEVMGEIFRAMNTPISQRAGTNFRPWADQFPYVNGGLFEGATHVPRFTRIARTYLQHASGLNWKEINPDIFGSMIQAVADDDERSALGLHYTSVPNILKLLNPLFLDDLHRQLDAAGDAGPKLLALRKRMAHLRVFDPACGSGNFLVIAYKKMREIESKINQRLATPQLASEISLRNFRGIELRNFPAEIARLALIIAEFQCDVLYRGEQVARAEFLPLDAQNWIVCGNALRLDWLHICPPTGVGVKVLADDLFRAPLDQAEVDFENAGGETFICGNPPYLGSTWQTKEQKAELQAIFDRRTKHWKSLDYVAGWFMKAADYGTHTPSAAAFVSTNSICQGQQVPILWPLIFGTKSQITFAHTSFKWANLASHNAVVTVVIVGLSSQKKIPCRLYCVANSEKSDVIDVNEVDYINAYLVASADMVVEKLSKPHDQRGVVEAGGKPVEGGNLLLTADEKRSLLQRYPGASDFLKRIYGASEYIRGDVRYCLWLGDDDVEQAISSPEISARLQRVAEMRLNSPKPATQKGVAWPHRFEEVKQTGAEIVTIVPKVSSESREYLPVGLLPSGSFITDLAFALYDAPLWNMALIASRTHLVWVATVCGKMGTGYRYSNTLGWNTFPVPPLTEQNKTDLTECAEHILLAREVHFPATIADLYAPDAMPENLRHAHARNDEVLERIYIGRRFKNDTERLEKLFALYTKMTAAGAKPKPTRKAAPRSAA